MNQTKEIEYVIKEFNEKFMNNGVNGVLIDNFQDEKMIIIRDFLKENLILIYQQGKIDGSKIII